jgi:hypothetical protein
MRRWSPAFRKAIRARLTAASPEGTSTVPAAPERSDQADSRARVVGVPFVP